MVNIKKKLIRDIAIMSVISGIAAPIIIHRFFLQGYPIDPLEFTTSLISNFILGWFIYYVIVRGNLKEYFDNVTEIFKKIRRVLEGSKAHSLEEIKQLKIEAEEDDFIYDVSKEINHFIENLYMSEILDNYQREVGKLFATLATPEVLAKSFYNFLLEKFDMVAMAAYMKDSEGIISKIACFNFRECNITDFIEACFNFKDLKLINVTDVKIDLLDETNVKELLIVPLRSIDVKGVLILAKPCKFSGFELKFLRRIRDLMSLGLTNARNYKRLQEESYLDPLTKLYNRRFGMKRLQELISLAARESKPLVVGMMDIDDFKKINDTYGHLAGDYVLRTLSSIVKKHVRDIDLVVRYGGEEILVVLFNTDKISGEKVFERIRKNIEQHPFEFEGNSIKVTVSIGFYPIPPEELTETAREKYKEFIEKADEALYKAKKLGKNRVVCYSRQKIEKNS
ncbi:GGDEF domain-containing protein [Desulfurobacterium indicum]|uniref:diguanylate cyclase n=1 Tax=Desulfurobacterium indicum TaxID=1914305 RepID=A0A1R1MKL3_9BACT|nr:sensor domain-containing diguanylate cyclase [Desulfurobacterium indicum]OMH40303.1 hypothetical protein BLW93_06000 [Desulfurobacterium indicum]